MHYYDISPLINPQIAVFPGDTAYRRDISMDFSHGDNLVLSSIHTTVHLGAHTDAPNHYAAGAEGIDKRNLDYYLGKCQLISVTAKNRKPYRIFPEDIKSIKISAPRVLFKTESFPDPYQWRDDFTALSPELIHHLHAHQVRLVGIDTPSIDPADCKSLESHRLIHHYNMAILEGIALRDVPEGIYTLIALPLRLENADASPVRAILLPPGTLE